MKKRLEPGEFVRCWIWRAAPLAVGGVAVAATLLAFAT
jgi:hypothetical protein